MKIIGLDVGEKRIGVAKVDSNTRIAIPVGFVNVDGSEWQEIARIARLNDTNWFVLGLPRSNEGNETRQSQYVRGFAIELVKKVPGAKIRFQDESLTSVEAENRLKSRKKPYQKGDIDAEAATIILQDFVEKLSPGETELDATSTSGSINLVSREKDKAKANVTLQKTAKEKSRSGKSRKIVAAIIAAVTLLILGMIGGFKLRDFIRAEREREYAEKEATMKANVFKFTILPGETIYDVKANLLAVDRNIDDTSEEMRVANYTAEEVEAAFSAEYDFEFLRGRPAGASLEGYLYPETHEFYATDSVETVLERFLEGMETVIQEYNLEARYAEHGLTLHQGITLASIVQKESGSPADQATVAQVFYSRLAYGWRLGSDVTVSYALDTMDPERQIYSDNAAALMIDSCYNTRLYGGLPCGPISNPGLSALLSVTEPADTAYLYFLTGDDGLMYYSYTEAEHNQKIYLYCQTLCNIAL